MTWLVFSYSLPSKGQSSPRVALWRRLRRLGAIAPTGGVHLLPAGEESLEAFQWLVEEVKQAKGDALVMHVDRFEGLSDSELIERFRQARAEDYAALKAQAGELEQSFRERLNPEERFRLQEALKKLQRRYADIVRVDFFDAPEGSLVASELARLERALGPQETTAVSVSSAPLAAYRDRRWVTRPRPHVDRLSCIWLIRRFINPQAEVRYSSMPEPGEVAFDMANGEFTHRDHLCTFETMVRAFGLEDPSLELMGEIIHEIDLRDSRYMHPETAGVDAILRGWLLAKLSDAELEVHGVGLFEGLYADLSRRNRQPPPR
jgi:hypothetical protein